jgi:hypothetical protein
MNKTVPNAKNWPDEGRDRLLARKRSGIRAINKGTSYDVPGKLRKLAREIEKGMHGEVRGAALAFLYAKDGKLKASCIFTGTCSTAELHMLACYLEQETGIS